MLTSTRLKTTRIANSNINHSTISMYIFPDSNVT